ncbi:MAG: pilus assembly protein PilM [Opitutaceae bacterium]|nr:pilus assembly protein PilM [Cephaloticoccus sp.]MCP5531337.1 pilus assembly protein PilM [Opitutaceae bacterium]
MSRIRILALDCGASHVAAGLFSRSAAGWLRLERYAREEFTVEPADDSRWRYELQGAVETMLRREPWRAAECVISVPGHLALTKLVKTPSVDREKRPRVAQFEASQNIPYPLEEVSWGYLEMADDGVDSELLLGAARLTVIESLCTAVQAAGPLVVGCEPANIALWRAVSRRTQEPVLTVKIGARSTQLVFTGGGGVHLRTLALGGNTITAAIAEKLQTDFTQAEALKQQMLGRNAPVDGDAITRDSVQAAVDDFTERLQLEIQRSRLAYLREPGVVPPGKIWVCGGGVTTGLPARLSAKLGMPVEMLPADSSLKIDAAAARGVDAGAGDLAVLTGLAGGALEANARVLDLLPPEQREARQRRQRLPWWIAIAALLVLLPAPLLLKQQAVRAAQLSEAAGLSAQIRPLRHLVDANVDNLTRLGELNERIAAFEDLTARRHGWVALLTDLQERFAGVEDVWLDSLEPVVGETETESGEVTSQLELALTGRFLDSGDADAKVRALFKALQESPFVLAVNRERFDPSRPGLMRFQVTLRIKPEAAL